MTDAKEALSEFEIFVGDGTIYSDYDGTIMALQQSLYRLVKECIVVMADETRNYDDRNRA